MRRWVLGRRRLLSLAVISVTCVVLFSGFAAASSEEGPKGWLATDTYRVMNFAVLFIGLFLLLRKPAAKALNGRIQGIKDQLAELEVQKTAAEAKLQTYKEKLAELDKEAERIVDEYISQGKEAKAKIIKAAEETAVKLEEQAKRNIDYEFKQAKAGLQADVLEKALAEAEKMLKEKISADDQNRLVDEYLDKVVA